MSRDINRWPYDGEDGMVANFKSNNGLWVETTERVFWDQLECVPPKAMKGDAFMVGECHSNNCYAVFIEVDERFFGKICGVLTFNVIKYTEEVKNQFGM